MNREEFIKRSLAVGIGLPFLPTLLHSCAGPTISDPNFEVNFSGKVLIIGAGAAGLTAGYLLQRNNIDFEIIEAANEIGGRMKRSSDFSDFPIDLGAEWIHDEPSIFAEMLSNPELDVNIDLITYNPHELRNWKNGKLKKQNWLSNYYSEYKFKSTTWYGFFERFMVPEITDRISLNSPVNRIEYAGDSVRVETSDREFVGDRVLVTIPIKILQENQITFDPSMPEGKMTAINQVKMGDGIKVFVEFQERFYPDVLVFGDVIQALLNESKTYYDAAFRKDSSRNILGLFAINDGASTFTNLGSDQAIVDMILLELDEIFDGQASSNYVKHIVQNWSQEPYIGGSYSTDFNGNRNRIMSAIAEPIDQKIYFAGEALSDENQGTVHGASQTAYEAVRSILRD